MRSRSQLRSFYDGVVRKGVSVDHEPDGFKINFLTSQDCGAVLDHNREVMAQGGSRTLSFGKSELVIPELVLQKLKRKYPELDSADRETKVKAWKKFIRSTESKPWRVSTPRYSTVQ